MVKIRLMRKGRKKKPMYRIVVIESANQRDGKTYQTNETKTKTIR